MKKIFGVLLSILCMCCIAIGLTGCKKDKHIHAFDKQVITDEYKATDATCTEKATYYYSCECGEKDTKTFEYGSTTNHNFVNGSCTYCGKKQEPSHGHVHSYDKQVISEEYLASSATCTEKATYYYSCECGEKGTETFEYGSTTNHNFVNGSCTYCGKKQETSRGLAFKLLGDGTYEVSGIGSCTDTEIVIPSVYNDKPVTSIGDNAFDDRSGLTSVTIPDSVTSIGEQAFYGCSGLTSVTIGNSVTSIGDEAFDGCSGLTSVTIGNSVTSIGDWAFNGCSGIESLVVTEGNKKYHSANNCIIETETKQLIVGCKTSIIPSDGSVTSIGHNAFWGCSGLTSVTNPDSVTSIGDWAFYGCSGLTSVTIGNSVTSIGDYAFSGCYKLVEVINKSDLNITKGSSNNGYIAYYALNVKKDGISDIVNKDGYLFYTYDNVNYLVAYVGSNTDLTLPDDYNGQTYELNNYAFRGCRGLTGVTIPDSVTSIGWGAFRGCSGLTSVTIPDSVTSIGEQAFYGCSGLTSVTIGNSVTSIGDEAFDGCSGLTSVTIGNSVTSIGDEAFDGCGGIESLVVTAGNKKYHSANNCIIETGTKQLIVGCKTSIIPSDGSVTSIGGSAFSGCSGLTSVTIPDSVTSIGWGTFRRCSGLTSVTIGNSVTSIGNYAFEGCSGLTSITIENSVTSIGNYAFEGCSGLTSVTIENSVTSIGDSAFEGCSGLTSVTIPDSVTSIGKYAFV